MIPPEKCAWLSQYYWEEKMRENEWLEAEFRGGKQESKRVATMEKGNRSKKFVFGNQTAISDSIS
jgi:hypothetical protein